MKNIKVMIVEDERVVARDIQHILEESEYEVSGIYNSGEDALATIPKSQPDVVLMDIRLKGDLDGVETANHIKTKYNIPVIILSAFADNDLIARARDAGTYGYLIKPFEDRELNVTIEMVLGRAKIERQLMQSENSLREKSAFINSMINSSLDVAIIACDKDFKINYINYIAEKLLEIEKTDILGQNVFDLHARYNMPREKMQSIIDTVLDVGEFRLTIPTQFLTKNKILDMRISSIVDSVNQVIGFLLMARDITELIRQQEEQQKLERKMQELQKFESLNVMAGSIAHNFNNLLMAVMGYIELAQINPSITEIREQLGEAYKSAERAAALSKSMLTYVGQNKMQEESTDLVKILRETIEFMESTGKGNVIFESEFPEYSCPVMADSGLLRQTFMNIITNSMESIESLHGNIVVTVEKRWCDKSVFDGTYLYDELAEGEYFVVSIQDDGAGIPDQNLSRIFDPFFTTKFTGRGLGLAAVLGIIRAHKGAISVNSQPGEGTTFTLLFPESKEEKEAGKPALAWKDESNQTKGKVLLVDDESMILEVGTAMLNSFGYEVLAADSGQQAFELYQKHWQDIILIIIDYQMPYKDGKETISMLTEINSSAKIIVSSGYTEEMIFGKMHSQQVAGFIQKPYKLDDLRNLIGKVVS